MGDTDYDEIEKYLSGSLPQAEKEAMAEQIGKTPELKEKFLHHLAANQAIERVLRKKVSQQLDAVIERKGPPTIQHKRRWLGGSKGYLVAAAVSILLVVAFSLLVNRQFSDADSGMVAQYYVLASAPQTVRSSNAPPLENEVMQQGRNEFYIKEDYQAAAEVFGAIQAGEDNYLDAQYYLAHCQLKLGGYDEAIQQFEALLADERRPDYIKEEELNWNLLLSYQAAGEEVKAQQMLEKIIDAPETKEPYKSLSLELKAEILDK